MPRRASETDSVVRSESSDRSCANSSSGWRCNAARAMHARRTSGMTPASPSAWWRAWTSPLLSPATARSPRAAGGSDAAPAGARATRACSDKQASRSATRCGSPHLTRRASSALRVLRQTPVTVAGSVAVGAGSILRLKAQRRESAGRPVHCHWRRYANDTKTTKAATATASTTRLDTAANPALSRHPQLLASLPDFADQTVVPMSTVR